MNHLLKLSSGLEEVFELAPKMFVKDRHNSHDGRSVGMDELGGLS